MELKKILKKLKKYLTSEKVQAISDELRALLEQEESQAYRKIFFPVEEVIPFSMSDKAQTSILRGALLAEIFKDCSIYFFGYVEGSPCERILSKNLKVGGYPFAKLVLDIEETGKTTRFEVVSNIDLFCYMGGGVGRFSVSPMQLPHTTLTKGSTLCIEHLIVGL